MIGTAETLVPEVIASGYREFGAARWPAGARPAGGRNVVVGEAGVRWWLLRGRWSAEDLYLLTDEEHYGGPGQPYVKRPWAQSSRSYTLVTQRYGLDI